MVLAGEDAGARQKAHAALVGALEAAGDAEGAVSKVLELMEAEAARGARPCQSARLRIAEGQKLREAGELGKALDSFKEAYRLHAAAA